MDSSTNVLLLLYFVYDFNFKINPYLADKIRSGA